MCRAPAVWIPGRADCARRLFPPDAAEYAMTDKPAPPLNLIERMAQRLEKESAAAPPAQPSGANPIGRAMERDVHETEQAPKTYAAPAAPKREPVQAQAPAAIRRDGVSMI